MREKLQQIFQRTYRELRLRAPIPEFRVEFYAFTNVNSTIRLRQDVVHVRISDLLEGSPETVLEAIAHILLAKIYRKPIQALHSTRYRRYVSSHDMAAKAHLLRQVRGRKQIASARGLTYDLDEVFEGLNQKFFYGLLARPQMTWSRVRARNSLAHYDPAHNAIVVSRVFDHARVPRYAVEYIVYHEMLHLKHPVKLRGSRRCVHGPEFQAEERLFPELEEAKQFLKTL
ncbi:MAG TPA: SprT-like domain-containing protein [Terriglobales bacterium]|nr:SprT-like domain-containing protein [Terriglobales bacterium]